MKAINYLKKDFFLRVTFFMFWLVTCPDISGQAYQKRQLTNDDYKLWSQLNPDKISMNGKWVSYNLTYQYTENDTLIVQNSNELTKKIIFPNAKSGKFNAELHFACIARDTFNLLNIKTLEFYKRAGVSNFEFSSDHKYVVLILNQPNGKFGLEIMDTQGKVYAGASDITQYSFDPKLDGIVYCNSQGKKFKIVIFKVKNSIESKIILESDRASFKNIIWKRDDIAFIENIENNPVLYNYNVTNNRLDSLTSNNRSGFPVNMTISSSDYGIPVHSGDGTKIFFWLKESEYESLRYKQDDVQIWNSRDKLLFDFQKYSLFYTWSDKLAMWNLKDNKITQITDKNLPKGFLAADYRTAFIYDPAAYEPQTKQNGSFDLYAVDLNSGEKSLVVKNYSGGSKSSGSPDGKNFCYAKEGQWWIYNIEKKHHTCLTAGMINSFFNEDTDRPAEDAPYGIAGWTKTNQIILYDRYDLWLLSLDGKSKKRLTNGREFTKTFRVMLFDIEITFGDTQTKKYIVDLDKGFLMTTANKETGQTGLSYWTAKDGTKELAWSDKMIFPVLKAQNKNIYMYADQNFSSAPRLLVHNKISKVIMQSNKQQQKFIWPRNERIEYSVNGKKVKGILCYPAGYKKDEKYPMVVYIYERQFYRLNQYENPSLLSGDGFNITNFTAHGYFVLLPDIVYEFGNLRESVTKSVLAAVDKVLDKGDVRPEKVGLIGHSFGGYESDLIITQTNRFAAAVAGSALTDLISTYLYVDPSFRRPNFFRTENHQLRIGKSLYEDMPSYLKNSPVLLASEIKTPLLGWVGEEDRHVHSLQTMEFYLALRRLNKEHSLLVYPLEGHEITSKTNQIDLSLRIMQWFDHYLKNSPKDDWMMPDFKR